MDVKGEADDDIPTTRGFLMDYVFIPDVQHHDIKTMTIVETSLTIVAVSTYQMTSTNSNLWEALQITQIQRV